MSFSTMGMFLLCLILAIHSLMGGTPADALPGGLPGTPWTAALCCNLEEQAPSPRCHLRLHSSSLSSLNHLPSRGVVCLNILCWVDGNLENVICNLKLHDLMSDTSRPIAISLERLPSQFGSDNMTDSGAHGKCEGQDVRTCSVALHSVNSAVSLMISISDGSISAQSPAMDIIPIRFFKPDPPLNLQYHVTIEGELRLSWTHLLPSTESFVYDIRYSSSPSLHSWMHTGAEGAPGASLKGLSVGLNYTVQVRCKTPGDRGVWSDWSRPLHMYLHEVSYIPERLFTSTGSNITVYCIFNNRSHSAENAVWWLSYQKVPESQYTIVSDHVSSVTLLNVKPLKQRGYDILHCCQREGEKSLCSFPYAQIYVTDISTTISCEVDGDLTAMTCTWNTSQWTEVKCLYQRHSLPCEEDMELPPAEECPVLGAKSCRLEPLFLTSCYIMWVEGREKEGTVKSSPIYILPIDLVKPHPPFDVRATSLLDAHLSVWWKRPELPVYELQFEVRYSVDKDDTLQKVIRSVTNQSAVVPVVDPCMVYTIQVRCKRLAGPGFWSDWSRAYYTTINNTKAPEQGPDFWRVLQEYPKLNQTHVTLLFMLSQSEASFCCLEGLTVKHQTSRGSVWSENLGRVSSYSFFWSEDVHTVTAVAHNALGSSTKNSNMTLTRHTKSQSIHSFSSVMVNSSCVALSWTLYPNSSAPSSFVIQWNSQSRSGQRDKQGGRVKWVRVPPSNRAFHLHETFFSSEEYHFILFPIFENAEGEPVYAKEDRGRPRWDRVAYMLLLIITFLSVVLFVTLAVSQNQMRKLVWKDVPNPNNCSWAQGVDFRKAETIESLFRYPERLISCPLLLESENISEAVIVEKTGLTVQIDEMDRVLSKAGPGGTSSSSLPPCGSGGRPSVEETSLSLGSPDGSAQSRISYSTVLFPGTPDLRCKQQESLSGSSDEGNFSANNSDISGSFPGGLWELENPPSNDPDLRRSGCYHSELSEEFSETSDQEEGASDGTSARKEIYYLGMASQSEGEEEEEDDKRDEDGEEEEVGVRLPGEDARDLALGRWDPKLDQTDAAAGDPPLYVPQFQTAPRTSQPTRAIEWSGVPPGLNGSELGPVY